MRARTSRVFDWLEATWGSEHSRRARSTTLLTVFVLGLSIVEAQRWGFLVGLPISAPNHLVAIEWAVDILLVFELFDLVFALGASVASSLGKQLEVFALILLRKSFEELSNLPEPVDLATLPLLWTMDTQIMPLWYMAVDALGALLIFGCLAVYREQQMHRRITASEEDQARFVEDKKTISMALLTFMVLMVGREVYLLAFGMETFGLLATLFTGFIFSDIAIVLVSLRYSTRFRVVFRNFGFTIVTVFLRLAVTAGPFERAAIGTVVAAYAVLLAALYRFSGRREPEER